MDGTVPQSRHRKGGRGKGDAERTVSHFFESVQDHAGNAFAFLLRHPVRTVVAAHCLLHLPVLEATTTPGTIEGTPVDHALAQRHTKRRFLLHASVLALPREAGQCSVGPSRMTLRRMARKAARLGITCSRVEDPVERRRLLREFDEWERTTPRTLYRDVEAANDDLLDYRLWLVARSHDGRPLVLSVTPVDGAWALLRYFRTMGMGIEQSLARYALHQYLAEQLVHGGVRYLFDEASPARLPNGLRHYQRIVGFRLFRVRVRSQAPPASTARQAGRVSPPAK